MSRHDREAPTGTTTTAATGLRCVECGVPADNRAAGWQAFLADGIEFPRAQVLVYCPRCAEREFGAGSSRPSTPSR
jgi:hypothetical protein